MQQTATNQHDQKLQQVFTTYKPLLELTPQNDWKESKTDKKLGIVNYVRKDEQTGLQAERGEAILNFPAAKVINVFKDPSLLPKRQNKVSDAQILGQTPRGNKYTYILAKVPMIDDRDFLNVFGNFEENGHFYFVVTNIVDDNIKPEVKGKVRAAQHYLIHRLTSVNNGTQTHLVAINLGDPKGSIPGFILKGLSGDRGLDEIKQLIGYLEKN